MPTIDAHATAGNSIGRAESTRLKASRRDAPVICDGCGRQVERRSRQQRFCSTSCQQRARVRVRHSRIGPGSARAIQNALRGKFAHEATQIVNEIKVAVGGKIRGPGDVLAIEVFGRPWRGATSSGGVALQVSRVRARALVAQGRRP
jgi:hypothetical protein